MNTYQNSYNRRGRAVSAPARTDELQPGMTVLVPGARRLQRTVANVGPTGYVNGVGQPILAVLYAEGRTDEWSGGNSALPGSLWSVVTPAERTR